MAHTKKRRRKSSKNSQQLNLMMFVVMVIAGAALFWWTSTHADEVISPVDLPEGVLEVHLINVGQADCILIKEPHGKAMLIDAGNPEDWKIINNYLSAQKVEEFENVIFTHPHADHIGSAAMVVKNYPIANLYMPDVTQNSATFRDLVSEIENRKTLKVTRPKAAKTFTLGDAVFTILAPNSAEYSDKNDYSIAVRMVYGDTSFMFTGDATKKSEKEILKLAEDNDITLKSDFMKAGHHGSKTSNSDAFVAAVRPKYAHITCAEDNTYAHPHQETLDTFDKYHVQYTRADVNGTVIVYSDGEKLTIVKENG